MIVIYLEHFENFIKFIERRIVDEIFYEIRRPDPELKMSYKILFHFLGNVGTLNCIYETEIELNQVSSRDELLSRMKKMFAEHEINLIEGKVREVFLSIA